MKKQLVLVSLLAACGSSYHDVSPDAGGPPGNPQFATGVVVAGDFNVTGVLSTVRVPTGAVTPNAVAGVAGGDPFVRRYGSETFIINRDSGDNVTVLGSDLSLVGQFATGDGTNPQDAVPIGNQIYVAALASKGVVVIDRDTSATSMIDLSSLDAVDGDPDCVSVAVVGGTLYAACGILDENFAPRGNGKIAVIDPVAGKMTASFDLPATNPQGYLVQVLGLGGDLVIATDPDFQDYSSGGLARVSTGATPAANGFAVTNAALGGVANHYEVSPDGKSLWIDSTAYDANFDESGKIVSLDLGTKTLAAAPMTPASVLAIDVAACPDGYALVMDGTVGAAGARIYQADGTEVTAGANDIGRAPGDGNNMVCY